MSTIYVVSGKLQGFPVPYVLTVLAESSEEAVVLGKISAKNDGYRIIKNSFWAMSLEVMLKNNFQKKIHKSIDIENINLVNY